MKKKQMRGLLHTLNSLFYPSYKYENATTMSSSSSQNIKTVTILECKGSKKNCKPKRMGKFVDRSITKWLKNDQKIAPSQCQKQVYSLIIPFLKSENFSKIDSQVLVQKKDSRLKTKLDVLADNRIFEVKLGFENYWLKYNEKMNYPFQDLDNCPQNQHLLQLLFSIELYEKQENKKIDREKSAVLRVFKNQLDILYLPKFSEETIKEAWKLIDESKNLRKKDRNKIIRKKQKIE